jgi:redox-sensitive bicupin YhaK (pirin superfamily)
MVELRASDQRGFADHGWLKSRHTFSFADYFDPQQVEFGALRVINEDRVAPGAGFGEHGHRDMEIISYVLQGELEHTDSMGTGSIIKPGDVQRMSAGRGVRHSEYNPSSTNPAHFLQIWIKPNAQGTAPSYEQKFFSPDEKRGRLRLIVSGDGADGSVRMQQDARLYAGLFDADERAVLELSVRRQAYVHLARGHISVNGKALTPGDGLKIRDTQTLEFSGGHGAEVLVFDLPQS